MQNSPPPPPPLLRTGSLQTGPDRTGQTCDVLLDVELTRKAAGEKRLEAGKWPKSCDKLTLAQLHTSAPPPTSPEGQRSKFTCMWRKVEVPVDHQVCRFLTPGVTVCAAVRVNCAESISITITILYTYYLFIFQPVALLK